MRYLLATCCLLVLTGCGGTAPAPKAEATKAPAKPVEAFGRFPKENLVRVRVVEAHLMGKPFLTSGSVAEYRKGKTEYSMFVTDLDNPNDAAIALLDYKRTLTDSRLVPAFGGYFGKDDGKPAFVFSKGKRLAGIVGLSEKEADLPARQLASAL